MNEIHGLLRAARRRMLVQTALTFLAGAWLAALGFDTALLLLDRLLGLGLSVWVYALSFGVATLLALGRSFWAMPSDHAVAVQIDQRLGLKDQIASALYANDHLPQTPLAPSVVQAARQTALTVRLKPAFSLRLPRVAAWVPPALLVLLLMAWWLPNDWLKLAEKRAMAQQQQEHRQAAQARAREEMVQAVRELKELQSLGTNRNLNELSAQALVRELEELQRKDLADPSQKQQTLVKLSDAQQQLMESLDQQQQQLQTAQNAFSALRNDRPGPADRLAQAMQRGDFANALKELQRLADEAAKLPADQRQALEQQLQNLADQLAQIAQQQAQQQSALDQQMQQAMQQQGMTRDQQQQIRQMLQNGASQQQIQQTLQQQGMDPQQARQLSQQLCQSQQQCSNCHRTGQGLEQLSQGLGRMSGPGGMQTMDGQAWSQSQQSLTQMAQMQHQLQQMKKAQSQMQQAMRKLESQDSQTMGVMSQNPGQGGSRAGTADAQQVLGAERSYTGYQTQGQWQATSGQGRTLASWLSQDGAVKNEAAAAYQTALKQAQDQAEQAVNDDRVPWKYHQTIKEYFNQMPQPADQPAPSKLSP